MTIFHLAVADDDVFGWLVPKSAIVVATTLDGNTVVTSMEEAVLYEYILTSLRVAAVSVRTFIVNGYTAYRDVLAEQWVDDPEWRVEQRYIFDKDALAAYEVDELWAETLSESELALVELYAIFCLLEELGTRAQILSLLGDSLFVADIALPTIGHQVSLLPPPSMVPLPVMAMSVALYA